MRLPGLAAAALAVLVSAAAGLVVAQPATAPVDAARLMASAPAPTLDAYHLFRDARAQEPAAGLTPYALNTPLFSDYAEKSRFVYLPPGAHAAWRPTGVLDLPVGAVLVKTFSYPADMRRPREAVRKIETRLLIHRADGWTPLTYVWNAAGDEAELKRAGLRTDVSFVDKAGRTMAFSYAVPNVNQCKQCHALDGVITPIGPKARNLNGDYAYAAGSENQLAHWTRLGLLAGAPAPDTTPAVARWDDASAPLADRARAYLDSNCGHCHNPAGLASNSGLYLDWEQADALKRGAGKRPVAAGRAAADLDFDVAPGEPDRSILIHRMASRDPGVMMPEMGRSLVHQEGIDLIRAYVASLRIERTPLP